MAKKETKSKSKTNAKARINYKQKYEKALIQIKNLEISLIESKTQNEININSFQEKAKGFQTKAQKEVDKIKKTLNKKMQTQIEHFKKYANQELFESSLEILLNLELAIQAGSQNSAVKDYVAGFKMLINQLYENLANYNVKRIKPQIGDSFNHKMHYVVETKKGKKNKILEVKRDGFVLHDRILKPAFVVIGK